MDREMKLNDAGRMIQAVWDGLPIRFHHVELDEVTVMPNHIHGIIVLTRRGGPCVRPPCVRLEQNSRPGEHEVRPYRVESNNESGDHKDRPCGTLPDTVGRIVQAFKSIATHEYTNGVKQSGWLPFQGKLWQPNYWEHIVRNEPELTRIREYTSKNPAQWELDKLNPTIGQTHGFSSMEMHEPSSAFAVEAWMI